MSMILIRNGKRVEKEDKCFLWDDRAFKEGQWYRPQNTGCETVAVGEDKERHVLTEDIIKKYFYTAPVQTEINGSEVDFLGGGRFLQVYRDKVTGYEMFQEPMWNDFGVGILAYRFNASKVNPITGGKGAYEYLMVMEHRPCHGKGHRLYSTKGGMEPNMTPKQCAIKELMEETGYIVNEEGIVDLGEVFLTTMSLGKMALFAVDVTNAEQGERKPDGSAVEATAFSQWVDRITLIREGDNLASRMLNLMEYVNYPETEDERRIKHYKAMTAAGENPMAQPIEVE